MSELKDKSTVAMNVVERTFHDLTKHISVQKKLIGGAAIISVLLLLLLIFVLAEFSSLNKGFGQVLDEAYAGVDSATQTAGKIEDTNARLQILMSEMGELAGDILNTNQTIKLLERNVKGFAEAQGEMIVLLEEVAEELPESEALYFVEDSIDFADDAEESIRREGLVTLAATVTKMNKFKEALEKKVVAVEGLASQLEQGRALSQKVQTGNNEIASMAGDFGTEISLTRNTMLVVITIIVAVTFWGLVLLSRALIAPLRQAISLAAQVAGGDLDSDVKVDGSDETAQMLEALLAMQRQLRQVIRQDIQGIISSANQGDLSRFLQMLRP